MAKCCAVSWKTVSHYNSEKLPVPHSLKKIGVICMKVSKRDTFEKRVEKKTRVKTMNDSKDFRVLRNL